MNVACDVSLCTKDIILSILILSILTSNIKHWNMVKAVAATACNEKMTSFS